MKKLWILLVALAVSGGIAYAVASKSRGTPTSVTPVADVAKSSDACEACEACATPATPTNWSSFITAAQLKDLQADPATLVIDVRPADKYAAGHVPGAINLPGNDWRTPATKGGQGNSQDIFRTPDNKPDIARYEQFLSKAGVRNDHKVVVYGEHGGKADGTVPAMILSWLGHKEVRFLDGIGVTEWTKAGFELSKETKQLAASEYKASPADGFLWDLPQILENLKNEKVVFFDTRNVKEFTGEDKRDNQRGGHIPGAILCDYDSLLTKDTRTTLAPADVKKLLDEKKISPDKQIVLYCQTATRVSHTYLALKDLGYKNVAIYDQSWHEYGNLPNTPVEQ